MGHDDHPHCRYQQDTAEIVLNMDVEVDGAGEAENYEVREKDPVLIVLRPQVGQCGMSDHIDVVPLVVPDCVHAVVIDNPEVCDYRNSESEHGDSTQEGVGLFR